MNSTLARLALWGAIAASTSTASAFEPDVIIDNADGTNVEFSPSGDWIAETVTANAFRGTGKITNTTTANASRFARFYTTLPKSGPWQVFLWRNGRSSGAPNEATATITHADTAPSNVRFDGGGSTGEWVLAGVYWFDSAKEAEVKILHDDTGLLAVDAVRFSFAEAATVIEASSSNSAVTLAPNAGAWPLVTSEKSGTEETTRLSTTTSATATFTPTLPVTGAYDVSIWIPQANGAWVSGTMASTFDVDVVHRGTTEGFTVTIPSSGVNEGSWVRVGTTSFLFDTGPDADNKVIIKTAASGGLCVPADAVRFSKVGAFAVLMDNDDLAPNPPTDPSGVEPSPTPGSWVVIGSTPVALAWLDHPRIAFGPDANAAAATSTNGLAYTPALPEVGLYDAYIWYPYTDTSAPNTVLSVMDAQAQTITRTINQTQSGAQWLHAGRYILDPANAKLTIQTAQTGAGYTIADGILFLRDGEELDTDGDGLPDWREVLLGSSSATTDLNSDGIPDGWDTDLDGLSDFNEWASGSNPTLAHSDSDGFNDNEEYLLGTNPVQNGDTSSAAATGLSIFIP